MFSNVGNRIKNLAYGFFGGGVFSSFAIPLLYDKDLSFILGLLCTVVCVGVFYCLSLLIYGFGILVDNSEYLLNLHLLTTDLPKSDKTNKH